MIEVSDEIAANLDRTETNLRAAKDLLNQEYFDIASSRAYYTAFYAASALLVHEGIDANKHNGVIASIHRFFVKTRKLEEEGKNLNWLFELRSIGDYGVSVHVTSGEAHKAADVAGKFLAAVKVLLDL